MTELEAKAWNESPERGVRALLAAWRVGFRRRETALFLGPAFVASVAYLDPGNFATNIAGGSGFGYTLLWVLLYSNLIAILVQTLSARLGIMTGKTLPENCREHLPRPAVWGLWIVAEIMAMATDLAEFLGAALGFYLLFSMPLFPAALLTGAVSFYLLWVHGRGHRKLERAMMAFVAVIGACYAVEIFLARPDWSAVWRGALIPQLNEQSLFVAVGMLGATIMPHVVYLHSALVLPRRMHTPPHSRRRLFSFALLDVLIAMNLAWLINSAMIIMAAAVFFNHGIRIDSIEQAHQTLTPLLGGFAAAAFGIALIASGLSSATVGTFAGQVIIEGFLRVKIPVFLRRAITMIPALVVIGFGWDPLTILIASQVALSLALPFAIVPLVWLNSARKILGPARLPRAWCAAASTAAALIIALNLWLIVSFVV
ncbi:MAG: Nramp family divalent metal transporter [Pseudomonadota bacterium]